jgi:polar amino acid transport system ATP-binding protein
VSGWPQQPASSGPGERAMTTSPPAHLGTDSVGVSLRNVTKSFGSLVVVDDVSMDVSPGEVVAIIGPSGAGKSTLLRCINLLERPNSGDITVGDLTIHPGSGVTHKELTRLRRTAGMVFQSFNLFPHLTVLRNVSIAQERVLGRDRKEAEARSRDLLARVGLADKADTYPTRSSGGQQQRIAIARALAMEPKVMLFDEPTSALDPELGLEVLAVMRELAADGMTMIVVTHEIHFAQDVSDRVVVMADGRMIEEGPPSQVLTAPANERTQRFLRAVTDR